MTTRELFSSTSPFRRWFGSQGPLSDLYVRFNFWNSFFFGLTSKGSTVNIILQVAPIVVRWDRTYVNEILLLNMRHCGKSETVSLNWLLLINRLGNRASTEVCLRLFAINSRYRLLNSIFSTQRVRSKFQSDSEALNSSACGLYLQLCLVAAGFSGLCLVALLHRYCSKPFKACIGKSLAVPERTKKKLWKCERLFTSHEPVIVAQTLPSTMSTKRSIGGYFQIL